MNTLIQNRNFITAILFSVFLLVLSSIFLIVFGKMDSFQLINGNHSTILDTFFKYYTYAGDGVIWVAVFLTCILFKRSYIMAVIAGIIISTVLSQFMKRVIFPDDLRPLSFLTAGFPVHVVQGVKMNFYHSFPSGHAAAAFTMALTLVLILDKRYLAFLLPALALLVGYSRIYLAQHFLTDVVAGTATGIISAFLSYYIYKALDKRKKPARKE